MKDRHLTPSFPVRIPLDLREWLRQQATANRRSLTGEIIYRLETERKAAEQGAKQ